jgi:hypothetical protein
MLARAHTCSRAHIQADTHILMCTHARTHTHTHTDSNNHTRTAAQYAKRAEVEAAFTAASHPSLSDAERHRQRSLLERGTPSCGSSSSSTTTCVCVCVCVCVCDAQTFNEHLAALEKSPLFSPSTPLSWTKLAGDNEKHHQAARTPPHRLPLFYFWWTRLDRLLLIVRCEK